MVKRIWKFLFAQKKPCVECQHLKYFDPSNEPVCFLNENVYKRKNITKYTCDYWNKSLEEIKAL